MRKLIALALVAMAIVALAAAPAFAEGYNDGGFNYNLPDGLGGFNDSGTYAGNAGAYTRATGFFSGPHGGYTTTTNKCQDCHSTHYATGSYKLLRANSAAAACDFCHAGGGGSTINIQMDNEYNTAAAVAGGMDSVIESNSMGKGTGHTLGYEGNAPADIDPAFSDAEGLACFSCHSPHGNSARIMTTFANPGRAFVGPGQQGRPTTAQLNGAAPTAFWPIKANFGSGDKDALLENGEWGIDYQYGNFVWDGDTTAVFSLRYRPIWPSGRFMLLKNPDREMNAGVEVGDWEVAGLGALATNGLNKLKIDWAEPLGPADGPAGTNVTGYGGGQDNDNDNAYPFAPQTQGSNSGSSVVATQGGFLSAFEFCTDCHDGTAGASTQSARVWKPANNGDPTVAAGAVGAYMTAYSHDVQPRH